MTFGHYEYSTQSAGTLGTSSIFYVTMLSLHCSGHYVRTYSHAAPARMLGPCVSHSWGLFRVKAHRSGTAATNTTHGDAGTVMHDLNKLGIERRDAQHVVKKCVDQAVECVLGRKATVQSQGSAVTGSSIPNNDWDFFVHKDGDTVTQRERIDICDSLQSRLSRVGIDYLYQLGENRVRFYADSESRGTLPDVDLVFGRYKTTHKIPPDNTALTSSHVAQQVVKYIKYLPYIKTHLRHPKSSLVEMVVIDILEQLKKAQPKDKLTGADGFDTLLSEVLSLIADPNQGKQLQGMRADKWFMQFSYVELDTDAWKEAARSLLNDFNNERGWLRPVARASEK